MDNGSNASERACSKDFARKAMTFVDGTKDLVTVVDQGGCFTYLNRAARDFLGAPPETLLGRQALDFVHPDDREATRQAFDGWLRDRLTSMSWENRLVSAQGTVCHALWTIEPQYDEAGKAIEVWCAARDVTAIMKYADRMRTTVESSMDGYWLLDTQGRLLEVNDAYAKMSGYSREELLSMSVRDLEAKEEREETKDRIQKILQDGGDRFESLHRRKNGELYYVEVSTSLLPGAAPRIVAFLRDINDRKRLEAKDAQESSVLKAVLDGIDDVIYVADPQTYELVHVNETFKSYWGSDVLGKKCYNVLQGRDAPCPFCTNDKIFGEYLGQSYIWEFQNEITGNWYRCNDRAIDWPDGRKVRFELASDITPEKKAQEALRASEARYRYFIELTGQLSWVTDPNGQVVEDIPSFRHYTGQSFEEVRGTGWGQAIHPEDRHRTFEAWQKAVANQSKYEAEYRIRGNDGEYRDFFAIGVPLLDDAGGVREWVGACIDITERKEAEVALLEQKQTLERQFHHQTLELQRQSTEMATIMDAFPGIVVYKDTKNRFVRVNKFVADANKMTKQDLEGKSLYDLYPANRPKPTWRKTLRLSEPASR